MMFLLSITNQRVKTSVELLIHNDLVCESRQLLGQWSTMEIGKWATSFIVLWTCGEHVTKSWSNLEMSSGVATQQSPYRWQSASQKQGCSSCQVCVSCVRYSDNLLTQWLNRKNTQTVVKILYMTNDISGLIGKSKCPHNTQSYISVFYLRRCFVKTIMFITHITYIDVFPLWIKLPANKLHHI